MIAIAPLDNAKRDVTDSVFTDLPQNVPSQGPRSQGPKFDEQGFSAKIGDELLAFKLDRTPLGRGMLHPETRLGIQAGGTRFLPCGACLFQACPLSIRAPQRSFGRTCPLTPIAVSQLSERPGPAQACGCSLFSGFESTLGSESCLRISECSLAVLLRSNSSGPFASIRKCLLVLHKQLADWFASEDESLGMSIMCFVGMQVLAVTRFAQDPGLACSVA